MNKAVRIGKRLLSLLTNGSRGTRPDAMQAASPSVSGNWSRLRDEYVRIDQLHFPSPYPGSVVLLWPQENREEALSDLKSYWEQVCDQVELRQIPGNNTTCLTKHVDALAQALETVLAD